MMRAAWGVLALVPLAAASNTSPTEKVLSMLEDLQMKVVTEGKAEAKTYDKYACFCKDMSEAKAQEITDGQDSVNDVTAKVNTLIADRTEVDTEISELNAEIEKLNGQMANATKQRKEENLEYVKLHAEIQTGYTNLNGAIKELKAKMSAISLRQVQDIVDRAVSSGYLRNSQHHAQKIASFLQREPEEYSFQSDEIIETVKDIAGDFKVAKADLQETETKAENSHNKRMLKKKQEKEVAETALNEANEILGEKKAEIAENTRDLTTTQAVLTDDQQYLKDLTAKCTEKAELWDQRSKMRQDELTAISTAITLVGSTQKDKEGEFVQMRKRQTSPVEPAQEEKQYDDDVDEIADSEVSFLQVDPPRATLLKVTSHQNLRAQGPLDGAVRDRIVALLKSKSKTLKSETLASLASKLADSSSSDPFAKIKKLVQELIERLLQEAADEANHKGWCDKELGKGKQKRDMKAASIKKLNGEMALNEAKRDKLTEEIEALTGEIAELESALAKQDKSRAEEKAENEEAVKEAEEGKEAVEEAIDVLTRFYKTAEKAAASFVQFSSTVSGPDEDAPDAGFDEPSKGSQSASKGVLGMLDVIKSDFERTISETKKAEKEAKKEYLEFTTTTKVSLGTKKVGKDAKKAELTETKAQLEEQKEGMAGEQELLDKTLQELIELQPACVDTGMSYEEKVAKREAEVESLKEALSILDQ